jgi:Flp pilus assembly protein protease CpaA
MESLWFESGFWLIRALILCVLGWIVYVDSRKRTIPNFLTVSLLFFGLIFSYAGPTGGGILNPVLPGSYGIRVALISTAAVFVFGFLFFVLKLWGAGDAKLLMGLAVWLHWRELPLFLLLIAFAGGILALTRMLLKRNGKEVFSNLQLITMSYMGGSTGQPLQSADRMPFSWAIATAWLGLMFLKLLGFV